MPRPDGRIAPASKRLSRLLSRWRPARRQPLLRRSLLLSDAMLTRGSSLAGVATAALPERRADAGLVNAIVGHPQRDRLGAICSGYIRSRSCTAEFWSTAACDESRDPGNREVDHQVDRQADDEQCEQVVVPEGALQVLDGA